MKRQARAAVRAVASLPPGLSPAVLALVLCWLCHLAGWQGTDWAAQVYRSTQSARYGFILWDPGWYGGTQPLNYSVLYPLAAGVIGNWGVAVTSATLAAYAWDRLVTRVWPAGRSTSWYFAASTVVEVSIGQLPTLAGEALALAAMLLMAQHLESPGASRMTRTARLSGSVALSMAAALTSPVVGAFVVLGLGSWGAASVTRKKPLNPAVVAPMSAAFMAGTSMTVPALLFPSSGFFPFLGGDLAVLLAICCFLGVLARGVPRPVRFAAGFYALASVGLFLTRNQLGDNDARLGAYIGVPLVLAYLFGPAERGTSIGWRKWLPSLRLPHHWPRRWPTRPAVTGVVAVVAALLLTAWEWSPMAEAVSAEGHGAASTPAFYQPLLAEMAQLAKGKPVRLEVPPTLHHWEAAYVAPKFPLARGWERQLDMAQDPIFYTPGALTPTSYRAWLLASGVSYVALANTTLDYSATAEAALLTGGKVKGLQPVWKSPEWELWKVEGGTGLASAPAQVVSLTADNAVVDMSRAGAAVLKLRWNIHWSLTASGGQSACLRQAAGQWTSLDASRAGTFTLGVSLLPGNDGQCPASTGLPSG